jgi:hypothetical protein
MLPEASAAPLWRFPLLARAGRWIGRARRNQDSSAEIEATAGFHFRFDEDERNVLKHHDFNGQVQLMKSQQIPINIDTPPSPDIEITCRSCGYEVAGGFRKSAAIGVRSVCS